MKRFQLLSLLLVAALVFTACGTIPPAAETAPPQTVAAEPVPTEPAAPVTRTLIETHTIETFVGDTAIVSKTEYLYDPAGLLEEVIAYSGDTEVSRTTVENNEFGEPIRQTTVSGDTTTVTESVRTYDAANNLLTNVDTVTQDGEVTDIREYTYNLDHTVSDAVFTTKGDPDMVLSNTFVYDENGREILEVRTDSKGNITRMETEYNEEGRAVKSISKNEAGDILQYVENTYLEDGTVKQQAYAPDGTPTPNFTLSTYNEYGNPLTTETYIGDTLLMRMTYTYVTVTVG